MTLPPSLFAASSLIDRLDPSDAVGPTGKMVLKDMLLIVAIGAGVMALLLIWATRLARKRKRRRLHHSSETEVARANPPEEAPAPSRHHHHHRRRRRREEHRGRNATLAETGGLPPIRSESGPEPPQ